MVYISPTKQQQHVNLLDISNTEGQSHYVWIKNLTTLVHRQSSAHCVKHFICNRYLHGCNSQRTLEKDELKCQWTIFPEPDTKLKFEKIGHEKDELKCQWTIFPEPDTKLKFEKIRHQHPVEFFVIANLESFLEPYSTLLLEPTHSSTTAIAKHVPCSSAFKLCQRILNSINLSENRCNRYVEHFIDALQDEA